MFNEQTNHNCSTSGNQEPGDDCQRNTQPKVTDADRISNIVASMESLCAWGSAFNNASGNVPPEVWAELILSAIKAIPRLAESMEEQAAAAATRAEAAKKQAEDFHLLVLALVGDPDYIGTRISPRVKPLADLVEILGQERDILGEINNKMGNAPTKQSGEDRKRSPPKQISPGNSTVEDIRKKKFQNEEGQNGDGDNAEQ